jgi:adenosylcobinamide kinase/adenosylcobinamide-phosphate guanylyltransferase
VKTLVLGGNRSGKSDHAERLLADEDAVVYAATGRHDPADSEWTRRIRAHQERRPPNWTTVESTALAELLSTDGPPLLVDSITTWLAAAMDDCRAWDDSRPEALTAEIDDLCAAWATCARRVVAVSDEVGLGVVPETRAGRLFRDELGALNQRLAAAADEVVLVLAGQALRLR